MTDFAYAPQRLHPLTAPSISPLIRYLGVLLVWAGLTLIRPRLGWEIYRNRRADSPLRRSNRNFRSKAVEKPRRCAGSALNCP